ncbi:MAG TPA: glycoside hydrolase family 3 N-terminal domain-containing protein [Acidimicrobiales bacterium]|nr:glycoside hydrolase family 3 N-terminal domain-containing protein [Acidimicrobiales bacterium]
MRLGRFVRAATVSVLLAGVSSAAGCSGGARPSPRSVLPASTLPPTTTATTRPACTNASVLAGWSLQRRASLLLVAPVLDFDMATAHVAASDGAGGILFLGPASPPSDLASRLRSAFDGIAAPEPIAMADQEGGGIERLTPPVPSMPWPRTMAATMSTQQVQQLAAATGAAMVALGVKMDLAPVADVDAGPGPSASNPDGRRSFSGDPATASSYTVAFIKGLIQSGAIPVVKHFPGLGGATGNTDNGPASTQSLSSLQSSGLVPFRAAVAAGATAVMIANAAVPGLTSLPASLSSSVITGLLRQQLGFNGLILTDSLSAGAISAAGYDLEHAAVAAVGAGADMVLFGSTLTPAQTALLSPAGVDANLRGIAGAIATAVSTGELPSSRLDSADEHVLDAGHVSLC